MTENKLIEYFSGDDLAVDVWQSKYQVKNDEGEGLEATPHDMHVRLAREFARVEVQNIQEDDVDFDTHKLKLSKFGKDLHERVSRMNVDAIETLFFSYFDRFGEIVPQGSIMSILGHPFKTGSLSNCFVVPSPYDSYGGILKTDEHLVQLMKRRGGVGMNLDTLRPNKTVVSNAAGSSTGAPSFMHRYSNSTREVAQDGRRGALMLLMSVLHPDIFDFVRIKKDRTKVTGANISTMLTDKFLEAAKANKDFYCRFPVTIEFTNVPTDLEYNKLIDLGSKQYIMKIHAKELMDLIMEMAWENAEPGVAFIDRIINFSPDGVYEMFRAIASNPCGEQWLQAYDSCRLLALNLFSIVANPFTNKAHIDFQKLYEISYMQQRLADTLVDLEIEHVTKILDKIKADPEPDETKRVERELWENVLKTAKAGRRTGCGFTGLADMLAALDMPYESQRAQNVIREVCKTKMKAELDCSIDLAILRGTFEGYDFNKEFRAYRNLIEPFKGNNEFYQMLCVEFPEQVARMAKYGRRNVSWSTVAPTGTVSIMTQTTSGLEPLFLPYYMRRKKINPNDKNNRIDFTDQNGDNWQEFAILHPKFKDWIVNHASAGCIENEDLTNLWMTDMNKETTEKYFKVSPWFGSTANDINWEKRVEIQAIIQRYTTNAISSTINLPNNVTKEEVAKIYWRAWELGLKGVTVYRDGCRTGVLVSNEASSVTKEVSFSQKDAAKRPKSLDAEVHEVKVKGVSYTVTVSLLNNHPYEVFVLPNVSITCKAGKIVKEKKGLYNLYDKTDEICYADLGGKVTEEEGAIARLISISLRHGTDIKFLVEQLNKTEGNMVGFTKAITRTLSKYTGTQVLKEACPECGETTMIRSEGCSKCTSCGHSRCG